jgi:RimJ/RimL family protein N-acetyltransferase
MREVILPTGEPLVGTHLRLDPLRDADLDELAPILCDPEVYAEGYVMHRCATSDADVRDLTRERFLVDQGQADGLGSGRLAYAIRLVADGELGAADTLVGTSSLTGAHLVNESIHLGSARRGKASSGAT